MKKFFSIILFAGLLVGAIGCKGGDASDVSGKDSTAVNRKTTALEDSLSQKYGYFSGAGLNTSIQQNPALQGLDKDQVLKAFETILALDTTKNDRSYAEGLSMALRLYGEILAIEGQGVTINRQLLLNNLKEAFNNKDGFDINTLQTMQGQLSEIMGKVQDTKGKENLAAGKKYIEDLMNKDKSYKKTESGVVYKIVEPGTGETFKESATVDMKFMCKDINNKVILDQTSTPSPVPIAKMKENPVLAKLYDIVKTMKPGTKIVAVISGDQISTQQMGIAPNITIVCELTTVGLTTANAQTDPANAQAAPATPANVK